MTDTERTGAFLAQKRKEKGLTQLELAQALSVTNRAVSKWETGAGLPDADVLPALAAALGTTADAILRGEEPQRAGESPALWTFEAADTAGELREGAAALPQTGAIGRCIAAAAALALWTACSCWARADRRRSRRCASARRWHWPTRGFSAFCPLRRPPASSGGGR